MDLLISPKQGMIYNVPFNRIQAIASILKEEKGVRFYGGVSPSKIGLSAPLFREGATPFKRTCLLIRLTGFKLLCRYWHCIFGSFFMGAYLHQKLDLAPPLERERYSVQKHVLSYQVKISEGCFAWDAPTLLRGGPGIIKERYSFSTLTRGGESNPARVLSREVWHDSKYLFSHI
jgi:hypothetical protein